MTSMSIPVIELLHKLIIDVNVDKPRRISVDQKNWMVKEQLSAKDWYEQAIVMETGIKVLLGMSLTKQQHLIVLIQQLGLEQ